MNTSNVTDLYHEYFYSCLNDGGEPLSFSEWYHAVFVPFLSGRELVLHATN